MGFGIKLRTWGDFACFTRPEMKVERVSYDVMTPSAARGILEAVYWKPQMRWVVDRIHVRKPIRFMSLRRNEVGARASASTARTAMSRGKGRIGINVEDERQQRASLVLRDVEYVIEAHVELLEPSDSIGKHLDTFRRRVERGQCFHRPYLGCREFAAAFGPVAVDDVHTPPKELLGERDLGFMLHDIDYADGMTARYFRATLRSGVVEVPPWSSEGLRS